MTNIFLSKKFARTFNAYTEPVAPEVSLWNWNAQLFSLGRWDFAIFTEDKSLYSVVIPNIKGLELEELLQLFPERFFYQLEQDGIYAPEQTEALENLLLVLTVYGFGIDASTQAKINAIISKLKCAYMDNENYEDVRRFADRNMNAMPWKTIAFECPKEVLTKKLLQII